MSATIGNGRQKITLGNGMITLHCATFDSNVFPQPGPRFGSRSFDFTVCARVAATARMAVRELFEGICRDMDGGCLKNRREWINGGAAWELWRTRLKRATDIDLGRPRLSKIYWCGMPPYFFGKPSPGSDTLATIKERIVVSSRIVPSAIASRPWTGEGWRFCPRRSGW
jgi:hypothetical protein